MNECPVAAGAYLPEVAAVGVDNGSMQPVPLPVVGREVFDDTGEIASVGIEQHEALLVSGLAGFPNNTYQLVRAHPSHLPD